MSNRVIYRIDLGNLLGSLVRGVLPIAEEGGDLLARA